MRSTYRFLGYAVAALVFVQAASIALAFFGLTKFVDDGGTVDKAAVEDGGLEFTGVVGFPIHFLTGQIVIPLLAIALLVVSFFAKVPSGSKLAGFLLLAVVVQVLLGMFAHGMPYLGALHGANALLILGLGIAAGQRAGKADRVPGPESPAYA
jgi:hypothetical protein